MAASNESLATAFQRCKQSFEAVLTLLVDSESSPRAAWEDEASRLHLWGSNIGAAQSKANTSLDFRLRDADTVRLQIHKNLSNLDEVLHEALECIEALTQPPALDRDGKRLEESLQVQTSSNNSSLRESASVQSQQQDEISLSDSEASAEDLQAAFDDTVSLINSLFRMTLYIRNPSRRDQVKHRDTSAVANFEAFDVSHIENKFPEASNLLTQRLGQANTVRRANLRYWERHHKKLAYDETVNDAATIARLSESEATAFQPVHMEEEQEDTRSHFSGTSYMESLLGGETVRRPSVPEVGRNGAPFQCPICCYIITAPAQHEWLKHVFFDLQPYVCVFEDCKTPLLLYENRRDWFAHVITNHLSRNANSAQLQQMRCPLCHDSVGSLPLIRRHLARHLEEVAMFSLPNSLFGEETKMADDDDQADYSSDEEVSDANPLHQESTSDPRRSKTVEIQQGGDRQLLRVDQPPSRQELNLDESIPRGEPISESLLPISNQLMIIRRCLVDFEQDGGVANKRELNPFSMKLYSIDNMLFNGKFQAGTDVPEGQGFIIHLLNECYDLLYKLRTEAESRKNEDE